MTSPRDRVGAGLTLLLFGIAPWGWIALFEFVKTHPNLLRFTNRGMLEIGAAVLGLLGAIALLVALVVGIVAYQRTAAARRDALPATVKTPARAERSSFATTGARIAIWLGIASVWGGFGAIVIETSLGPVMRAISKTEDAEWGGLIVLVTVTAVARGAALIARPRSG